MSLSVASLHVYPIKSLGGFTVDAARSTDRGFEHDRRWMLVDPEGRFISQREVATMACLHAAPVDGGIRVVDVRDGATLQLPWMIDAGDTRSATVWNDHVEVITGPNAASDWFTAQLGRPCTLVYMPDATLRPTDRTYAEAITSLSDGFPYLIISQTSLDDLNGRLDAPIGMERFRPNIVIAGGAPFQEDQWSMIGIGDVRFSLVKPCARCVITTTDQRTGQRNKEPLSTLATYRKRIAENGAVKLDLGMNAVAIGNGSLAKGMVVTILGAH
ncbi:MAG: MOSC domain-containing protein [Flavobacteriales bacterium]|jgi:uncharacterized protein YcbX|nr:MOSC domain-containing protein [Flavobacteriales bacterium]MBK6883232.1 MOSC domain-containing protein [Flavobacteriales bacterium]MBK7103425.1 MOSC domain-containing protein [Flavobacteriales bacterium]MBK7112751.1 MOSC domain-containing protein [Flavobacteriales bacterium]MBK7483246.1 MOSC domain-containing protein [Flavobacteriales bacterium]